MKNRIFIDQSATSFIFTQYWMALSNYIRCDCVSFSRKMQKSISEARITVDSINQTRFSLTQTMLTQFLIYFEIVFIKNEISKLLTILNEFFVILNCKKIRNFVSILITELIKHIIALSVPCLFIQNIWRWRLNFSKAR